MKKSISYWAFPGGIEGKKRLTECFSEAHEAGFEAVELCCGETGQLNLKLTETQCARIRAQAERAEIEIASLTTDIYRKGHLSCNRVTDRNRAEQATKKLLQIGNWLGVDAVLFVPGAVDGLGPETEVLSYDIVLTRAKQGMKRLLKTAELCQVALAVENARNKFLLSPVEMRGFIDGFDSEYVGAYLDVGNALTIGYPEHWIRILGKRIKRVHFKDYRRASGLADGFCDLLAGDADWAQIMKALRAVGYDSYCTAEVGPPYRGHPMVRVRNTSAAMDAILAK